MSNEFGTIWELYTSSWKSESSDEKRVIFGKCLDSECVYNDPLVKLKDGMH
ncbi:hypothetical protein MNBD_GAMMA22-2659 [hydrothermal vent metagenome]|uniref:Uncharacterized protein n=1 Tax=hydrothermal vent metagenome TaxID=652676 RepID=A0A3B1ABN8_9ZZZZ